MASVDTVVTPFRTNMLTDLYQYASAFYSTSVHVVLTSDWLLSGPILSDSCSKSNEQSKGEVPQG